MGVMPAQSAIPARLRGSAFRVSDTDWHGLSSKRLRGPGINAPFHCVRSIDVDTADVRGLCLAYEPLLARGHVCCGVTAARLLGMPLPLALYADPTLFIGALDAGQPPRRRGVRGRRLPSGTHTTEVLGGFTTTDAGSIWCQLAPLLNREELTAVADYLISGKPLSGTRRTEPLCTMDELRAAITDYGTRPGWRSCAGPPRTPAPRSTRHWKPHCACYCSRRASRNP